MWLFFNIDKWNTLRKTMRENVWLFEIQWKSFRSCWSTLISFLLKVRKGENFSTKVVFDEKMKCNNSKLITLLHQFLLSTSPCNLWYWIGSRLKPAYLSNKSAILGLKRLHSNHSVFSMHAMHQLIITIGKQGFHHLNEHMILYIES